MPLITSFSICLDWFAFNLFEYFLDSCSYLSALYFQFCEIKRFNRFDMSWFLILPKVACLTFVTTKIFIHHLGMLGKISWDINLKDSRIAVNLRKVALCEDQTHPLRITSAKNFWFIYFPFIIKQQRTDSFQERIIIMKI